MICLVHVDFPNLKSDKKIVNYRITHTANNCVQNRSSGGFTEIKLPEHTQTHTNVERCSKKRENVVKKKTISLFILLEMQTNIEILPTAAAGWWLFFVVVLILFLYSNQQQQGEHQTFVHCL